MKKVLALALALITLLFALPAVAVDVDLSQLTYAELCELGQQINAEIEANHKATSKEETAVERAAFYFAETLLKGRGFTSVSGAFIDFKYTKDWDYFTLATHYDARDDKNKKHQFDAIAGVYRTGDEYKVVYFELEDEVILDERATIPDARLNQGFQPTEAPSEATERANASSGFLGIANVTASPTQRPTEAPTTAPTIKPTEVPTAAPTPEPAVKPTIMPTVEPTKAPTPKPTAVPTAEPSPVELAKAEFRQDGYPASVYNRQFDTLKRGDKGNAVKELQLDLIYLGVLSGSADGDYGPKTETAVKSFQKSAGIEATGQADSATQLQICRQVKSKGGFTSDGRDLRQASSPTPSPTQSTQISSVQSSQQTYVLNTNTMKFHIPSCPSVKQIKEKNKRTTTASRDELIKQGYSPCKRCYP